MSSDKIEDYRKLATQIRVDVLKMIYKAHTLVDLFQWLTYLQCCTEAS